jgi:hypothetical protein
LDILQLIVDSFSISGIIQYKTAIDFDFGRRRNLHRTFNRLPDANSGEELMVYLIKEDHSSLSCQKRSLENNPSRDREVNLAAIDS